MNIPHPQARHLEATEAISGKAWGGRSFKSLGNLFVPGAVAYASDFSWEQPDSDPWPDGMTGVTFVKCHLHNLIIPPGCTVIDCFATRFCCQNDGNDWLIDQANFPVRPTHHRIFTKFNLPIPRPEDIPLVRVKDTIDLLDRARELVRVAAEGGR